MPLTADTLRRVLDSVFRAPAYHWTTRPSPLAPLKRWLLGFAFWLDALHKSHPLVYQGILFAMVVLVVVIMVHITWLLMRTMRAPLPATTPTTPATEPHDAAWYRREADRHAALGRYTEAMQAEFTALVLALDARDLVRFHPSKTPAEYARETRLDAGARAAMRELVTALYGYAFARWPCGADDLAHWRARAVPERYAPAH